MTTDPDPKPRERLEDDPRRDPGTGETVRRRDSWLEASLAALTPAQRAILHEAAAIMREVAAR